MKLRNGYEVLQVKHDPEAWEFSPSGAHLAIGHNQKIFVYSVKYLDPNSPHKMALDLQAELSCSGKCLQIQWSDDVQKTKYSRLNSHRVHDWKNKKSFMQSWIVGFIKPDLFTPKSTSSSRPSQNPLPLTLIWNSLGRLSLYRIGELEMEDFQNDPISVAPLFTPGREKVFVQSATTSFYHLLDVKNQFRKVAKIPMPPNMLEMIPLDSEASQFFVMTKNSSLIVDQTGQPVCSWNLIYKFVDVHPQHKLLMLTTGAKLHIWNTVTWNLSFVLENTEQQAKFAIKGCAILVHQFRVIKTFPFDAWAREKLLLLLCCRHFLPTSPFFRDVMPLDIFRLLLQSTHLIQN